MRTTHEGYTPYFISHTELECLKLHYRFDIPGSAPPPLFCDSEEEETPAATMLVEHFSDAGIRRTLKNPQQTPDDQESVSEITYPVFSSPPLDDLLSNRMGGQFSKERCIRVWIKRV